MPRIVSLFVLLLAAITPRFVLAAPASEQLEFFESRIRPLLVEACYECHSSANKEGGLAVDHRQGMLTGGSLGPLIVPGKPAESLLLKVVRHLDPNLKMPRGGPKLKPTAIADLERWIKDGAVDPRDKPPTAAELAKETSWEQTFTRRREWWSFQPLRRTEPPEAALPAWNRNEVDRWVAAQHANQGLQPALPADPATLLRRVTLLLTGLPPTEAELAEFLADPSAAAYERVVQRLLASPRFGERWGRHWLDWFRYAETHGSEGDPTIPHAWQYRDYVIRALNDDVSYYQLVREHIAGDLLPQPRVDVTRGIRESALGTAHLRMVQHGYAPTDAHDEEVRFIDNQIDVISKAFMGLTVSCARCHHHKFDPISQDDFYAWYGIFVSCRPGVITVDTEERLQKHRRELTEAKAKLQTALARLWKKSAEEFPAGLREEPTWPAAVTDALTAKPANALTAWSTLHALSGEELSAEWGRLQRDYEVRRKQFETFAHYAYPQRWLLSSAADAQSWFRSGSGLSSATPSKPGAFHVTAGGEQLVSNLFSAGYHTHLLSTKQNGVLQSPRFKIDCDELFVRAAGGSNARVRYVVHNYPRVVLIYPHSQLETESAKWFRWDCRYWKGEDAHLEIVTGDDQPIDVGSQGGRSWFSAIEAFGRNLDQPGPAEPAFDLFAVLTEEERRTPPQGNADLAKLYQQALTRSLAAWEAGTMTDPQAEFLGYFVRKQLLPNFLAKLPAEMRQLAADFRRLESEIPLPTRAPGVHEGTPLDQPLFERGNHNKPLHVVPRRFLELFDRRPYQATGSGRVQLAASLADPQNPLIARVIVNRVWQYLFGQGLVRTPDNFGRLGEEPSHPELLDALAIDFSQGKEAGSLKGLIHKLVLTEAFRQGNLPAEGMREKDPDNKQLTRFAPRRLEAEAIRDSLLAVTAGLDETRFGPSVAGNSRRRSIYVQVRRNSLDPFLTVFDAPEPTSALGRRDATNVPAQSLTLLNDPFVNDLAQAWANKTLADPSLTDDNARVRKLIRTAIGREPTPVELQKFLRYLQSAGSEWEEMAREIARLRKTLAEKNEAIAAILKPVEAKLLAARKPEAKPPQNLPAPLARWEFDGDLRDSLGSLHGHYFQGKQAAQPVFEQGALRLDGTGSVTTTAIPRDLTAKTLEAWVELSQLEQRAGGVISLETPGGETFDALVFGEQEPRRWMAGSNFFRRTKAVGGLEEREAAERVVHLAIVYGANGQIAIYRDGLPYGKEYGTGGVVTYKAGEARVLFGLRHSPPTAGRFLQGKLHRAQLYDRALSAEEVAASARSDGSFIPRGEILAALSITEKRQVVRWEEEVAAVERELSQHRLPAEDAGNPARKWQDVCLVIMNWKEMLYLR